MILFYFLFFIFNLLIAIPTIHAASNSDLKFDFTGYSKVANLQVKAYTDIIKNIFKRYMEVINFSSFSIHLIRCIFIILLFILIFRYLVAIQMSINKSIWFLEEVLLPSPLKSQQQTLNYLMSPVPLTPLWEL